MVNYVERVDDLVIIRRVLLSVSDKAELDVLVPGLLRINPSIHFYSTGGTLQAVSRILGSEALGSEALGSEALGAHAGTHLTPVSDYTGQPETQGGLVKTLDFKIYLGLLTETYNEAHRDDLARTGALPIDMVVVNLYPFGATVAREGVTVEQARANIDIGGPCMLRAAAKNYLRVVPVVDPGDYAGLLTELEAGGGALDLATRYRYARKAFRHTAAYDAAIAAYLDAQAPEDVPGVYTLA